MGNRTIDLIQEIQSGLPLFMPASILEKSCKGILKNAIENTPDEGVVEISAKSTNGTYQIDFKDYGVGITDQSQKMIFGGFFHTQDTEFYSSKRPYQFNAGGAGSDLLRIKCFSERYGFSVGFVSSRCRYLPSDSVACPGKISDCPFIAHRSECFASGGSTFTLSFPLKNFKSMKSV